MKFDFSKPTKELQAVMQRVVLKWDALPITYGGQVNVNYKSHVL